MREAYEILRDPCDRYVLWDLTGDAPIVSESTILSFPELAETVRFLETLRDQPERRDEVI